MFQRGFKTWCENVSLATRAELGIDQTEPLPTSLVAGSLGVVIMQPSEIVGLTSGHVRLLVETESDGWSAVTVGSGERVIIITNPTHSVARTSSDIMHELAHLIIGHEPARVVVSPDMILAVRTYDQGQEEEAAWLSGCLLLPRPALLALSKARTPDAVACTNFGVSKALLSYRSNVTGVKSQMGHRRARRRA